MSLFRDGRRRRVSPKGIGNQVLLALKHFFTAWAAISYPYNRGPFLVGDNYLPKQFNFSITSDQPKLKPQEKKFWGPTFFPLRDEHFVTTISSRAAKRPRLMRSEVIAKTDNMEIGRSTLSSSGTVKSFCSLRLSVSRYFDLWLGISR